MERAASHRHTPKGPRTAAVRSAGGDARLDVGSSRGCPVPPRTTRAIPTLIVFDVSTARMSLARLDSLRAVRRRVADGSGFAAVDRLRRLCQGAH